MKILGTLYGRCDISDWQEAEKAAEELLEEMDFMDIEHLSKKDAIFPFDYLATKIHMTCICDCIKCERVTEQYYGICADHIVKGEKYLIDVTLRTEKAVRTKRLRAWRAMGYITALLVLLPKRKMAILIEIEPDDRWVRLSPTKIRELEFDNAFAQARLN